MDELREVFIKAVCPLCAIGNKPFRFEGHDTYYHKSGGATLVCNATDIFNMPPARIEMIKLRDAVIDFAAWLTTLKTPIGPFSEQHEPGGLPEAVAEYCRQKGWE